MITINTYVNILLHIFILFIFLTVFFFYKISKLTETKLNNELGILIDENMTKLFDKLESDDQESLKKVLKTLNLKGLMDYYDNVDIVMEVNNNWNFSTAIIIIISLFLLLLLSIILLKYVCGKEINLSHIIGENIVIFSLIGIIEVLFFLNVGMKYIPILPSKNITTLIDTLKQKI